MKLRKVIWDLKFRQNEPKLGAELVFFSIFSSLFYQLSFTLHAIITWNNFELLVELILMKIVFGTQVWVKQDKIRPGIRFFFIQRSLVY